MNVNRVRHLENAISHFERLSATPEIPRASVETHLRAYYKAHRQKLTFDDKEWISDKFKDLYRWKSLVDHFTKEPHTTGDRLRTFLGSDHWKSYANSKSLPDHVKLSLPEELFETLAKQYGKEKARSIASTFNEKPQTTLRVNPLLTARESAIKSLIARGITAEPTPTSDVGIKISRSSKLADCPELKAHQFDIQDESCQIVGNQILADKSGMLVLDFCAGSGGKSLVLGPKLGGKGHLYLHDTNPQYLQQAKKKLTAASIKNFSTLLPDSPQLKKLKRRVDWVLVDAPSTGSGQYRRYPERKWLYTNSLLTDCVDKQRVIFESALKYLKKNGKITYSVSSVLGAETWEQIKYLCDHHDLYLSFEPVYSLPVSHGMDGFFCATMERKQ